MKKSTKKELRKYGIKGDVNNAQLILEELKILGINKYKFTCEGDNIVYYIEDKVILSSTNAYWSMKGISLGEYLTIKEELLELEKVSKVTLRDTNIEFAGANTGLRNCINGYKETNESQRSKIAKLEATIKEMVFSVQEKAKAPKPVFINSFGTEFFIGDEAFFVNEVSWVMSVSFIICEDPNPEAFKRGFNGANETEIMTESQAIKYLEDNKPKVKPLQVNNTFIHSFDKDNEIELEMLESKAFFNLDEAMKIRDYLIDIINKQVMKKK